jgi:hypothetical protein
MADVTNLWPDPKFVSSDETTVLAYNHFENPSPIASLTGWNAAGTATVTLDSGAAIKGAGGVEVVSPDGTSGLTITSIPETHYGGTLSKFNFAVYVRAHAAMTLTASVASDMEISSSMTKIGWGDFGWGEEYTYVEGASHTFEAGEVKRLRLSARTTSSSAGTRNWRIHLLGTGTFDADAAWRGDFVLDGVDPATYPGGYWDIADATLYFDGSTADTAEFTYSWEGTANASRSIKTGHLPKFMDSRAVANGHENVRTAILAGGETGFAMQAAWEFNNSNTANFLGDNVDLKTLGLVEGNSYVLSIDVVSTSENYVEGYIGDLYSGMYLTGNGSAETGSNMPAVMRRRLHLPIIPDAGTSEHYLVCYRGWVTGESYFTDASLFEVEFIAPTWSPNGNAANLPLDLLAHGLEPGKDYIALFDTHLNSGQYYRVEYQTGGGGSWTAIFEDVHDAGYQGDYYRHEFTVPGTATAVRLVANTAADQLYFDAEFFSVPPEPFSGDTPDGGGYTYSWAGTPYESASIRSDAAAGPTAKVFVGGTAINITEMRAVVGGSLIPITEAGV